MYFCSNIWFHVRRDTRMSIFYIIVCTESNCDHLTYEEYYKELLGRYSRNKSFKIFIFRIIVKLYKSRQNSKYYTHPPTHPPTHTIMYDKFQYGYKKFTVSLKIVFKLSSSYHKIMQFFQSMLLFYVSEEMLALQMISTIALILCAISGILTIIPFKSTTTKLFIAIIITTVAGEFDFSTLCLQKTVLWFFFSSFEMLTYMHVNLQSSNLNTS